MIIAKIFQHGGSQALRLPKAFRFEGTEVLVEKRGDEVVLKPVPVPEFLTFAEIGAYFAGKFPESGDFPKPPQGPADYGGRKQLKGLNILE